MEKGGRTEVINAEVTKLIARGHNVTLVTFSKLPSWVLKRYPNSVNWQVIEKRHVKVDAMMAFRLFKLVRQQKPDLIHTHCETSALYLGLISKILRIPSVGTIHRSKLHFYAPTWANRSYYMFLDRYLAVSQERKDRMYQQLGLAEERIKVIHWGIDPDNFEDENSWEIRARLNLSESPIILSLGHLGTIKGHDESIAALAKVKAQFPDVKLYIGGDGLESDFERIHSLIEELKLQNSVILLGQISNPLEWMKACDIFLQPSREEAFGLVFLEAGICRKPTVATRIGGIPEIIVDGESGFLVEPKNPEQISERLCELLGDDSKVKSMGDTAHRMVTEKFLLNGQIAKLENYFQSLTALHKNSAG